MLKWSILIPVKQIPLAKSRLQGDRAKRSELARAFACDAVSAAMEVVGADGVYVATVDREFGLWAEISGANVLWDAPAGPLNSTIGHALQTVPSHWPLCILAADLPCATPMALSNLLSAASEHHRSFLSDAAGTGTTALLSLTPTDVVPRFGERSAAAHAADGFVRVDAAEAHRLRRDVDTNVDLWDAIRIGVGPYTQQALNSIEVTVLEFKDGHGRGVSDDGRVWNFGETDLADASYRFLRPGQRLRIMSEPIAV